MLLIQEGQESGVRMPKLAAFGSFAVNGVAEHEAELKGAVDALASAAVSGADRVASAEIISSILDRDEYLAA